MTDEVAKFDNQRAYKPARSPEQREMQMMALAMELSEKRLQARIDLIRSDQQSELDFKQAYRAFQGYSGKPADVIEGEFHEK